MFTDQHKSPPIDIEEDLPLQRKLWRIERIGWATMVLLLSGSLLGLCGSGPLGHAEGRDASGRLSVHYERLTRHQTSTRLLVRVRPTQAQAVVQVALDRRFLDGAELERTLPAPQRVWASGEQVVFAFGNDPRAPQFSASFDLRPVDIGLRRVGVAVPDVGSVQLTQWVFP